MEKMRFSLFGCLLLLFAGLGTLQAQVLEAPRAWSTENQLKDNKTKTYISGRVPVPYQHVREADVMYGTRIWRYIDVREKVNHPFLYPETPQRDRISFNQIILNAAMGIGDKVQIYVDEDFTQPMDAAAIKNELTRSFMIDIVDDDGNVVDQKEQSENIDAMDIYKYVIIEDWFFDKQRSVLDVRIIGICPIFKDFTYNTKGAKEVRDQDVYPFYMYFPDLRPVIAKHLAYNIQNNTARMSWDDVFFKRHFGSVIFKEENVYDRYIQEYALGLDALLEAERIKERIFNYEQDLWEY